MKRCSTLVFGRRGAPGRTLTLLLVAILASLVGGSAFACTVRAVAARGLPGSAVQVPIVFDLLSTDSSGINQFTIDVSATPDSGAVALPDLALFNSPYGSLPPAASPNNAAPAVALDSGFNTPEINFYSSASNCRFVPVAAPETGREICRILVSLPASAVPGTTYNVHLNTYISSHTGTAMKVAA